MGDRYEKLKPYIQSIDSTGNLHVFAPASLIKELSGFYKFEIFNEPLADDLIYANAWYRIDPDTTNRLMFGD